ncbi:uncharacterized protein LOC6567147 [Drosophila grimshawi]|uniref:GH13036 n=1 Tax=Drosophila grimshawi TaxID=7222 RepID=B4JR87_DROGR|nr:uncharacterized protein LOC6567147 [Drosophila grimshawi]EDV99417.1 GH13036 [Drosophila grimshawi]
MFRFVILLAALLPSTFANPIASCDKLEAVLAQEIKTFSRQAIQEGVQLLQRLLKEAELLGPNTADRAAMDKLAKFIENSKNADDSEELEDLLYELEDLLVLGDFSAEETDEMDEDLITKLLRQLGFDMFEQNLEKKLAIFMKRTESHIESYLMREKGFRDSKMTTWFIKFQNETDIEKKLFMLDDLFENFDC